MKARGAVALGLAVAAGVVWVAGGRGVEAASRAELQGWSADQQQNAPSAQQVSGTTGPTIQVYSRETVVDVSVTDEKGNPVHGLTKADFTVEQDGKPQAIRGFEEFGGAGPAAPAQTLAPETLPPNVYSNAQAAPANGPVVVILMDEILTPPDEMAIAKKELAKYLREMPAGTVVALYAASHTKGFWLLHDFTTDGAAAAASVEGLDPDWLRNPGVPDIREAMKMIAEHVAGIKGKKNLIWFASHPPVVPPPCGAFSDDQGVRDFFKPLMAAQFAVYPVAAEGLKTGAPSMAPVPPGLPQPPSLAASMQAYALRHSCDMLGMEMEAEATGGKALYNSNDFKGMVATAVKDGSSGYTLTYATPPMAMDTRFHSIQVKVDQPGMTLAYRNGFNAETQVSEVAAAAGPKLMQASMERGMPPVNQVRFDVQVQPGVEAAKASGAKGKNALTRYGFVFSVPPGQIAFTDGGDGVYRGALEFDVVAFDASGRQVTMLSQTLKMPLSVDGYADFVQKPLQFRQQIDLPAGQMVVRAGILDKVSNKVGTLEIPLTVAKAAVVAGK